MSDTAHLDEDLSARGGFRFTAQSVQPFIFAAVAIVLALGSFAGGAFFSLGKTGIAEILEDRDAVQDVALRPTYEWIEIEKTIYQLDRRDDAKYVLAEFVIQVPIEHAAEVRSRLPEVEFALQTYIRELSSRELQGAMGLYNLRSASLFRARRILGHKAVEEILIG
ncbi:MAG: flagellar basal body-associated FliL family protein, partial [Parvularcula sp.]|nr:flagellar basal body-associated FliL family protein [Parvularcula sp.]